MLFACLAGILAIGIAGFWALDVSRWMPDMIRKILAANDLGNSSGFTIVFSLFCWIISSLAILAVLFPEAFVREVNKRYALLCVILFAGFILYTGYRFFTLGGPFFHEPISNDDYLLHYTQAIEVARHLRNHFTVWGYNPFQLAGDITSGIDCLWPGLFVYVLGRLIGNPGAFNISVATSVWLPLFLAMASARNFGLKPVSVLGFVAVTAAMLIGFLPVRAFYYFGCFSFMVSFFLCLYTTSLLYRYIERRTRGGFFLMTALGVFCLLVHPLSAVIFPTLAIPLLIVSAREMSAAHYRDLALGTVSVIAIILTWWILPTFSRISYVSGNMQTSFLESIRVIIANRPLMFLMLLAAVSFVRLLKNGQRLPKAMLGAAFLNGVIAFFGSQMHLGGIEPNRFIIPFGVILSLVVMMHSEEIIVKRKNFLIALTLATFVFLVSNPLPPFVFGVNHDVSFKAVLDYFKAQKPLGRILLQNSPDHPYAGSHVAGYLAAETGFETTSDEFPVFPNLFPQFSEDSLFGHDIVEIPPDTLLYYCELYFIRYALVYSKDAKEKLEKAPFCRKTFVSGPFAVFECDIHDTDFCIDCSADTRAALDEISVTNASSPVTVLKYHYFPLLKIQPSGLRLRPRYIGKDPMPFIEVRNDSTRAFRIFL